MGLLGWLFGNDDNPIIGPARGTRPATGAEQRALNAHERRLRAADRRDGGHRYRQFRAGQDAAYRRAQARDPWIYW